MSTDRIEIHASPHGSVFADGSRGYPVRDLHSALRLVRQRRRPGQRAVVWLEGGTYRQSATLELTPDDSFTAFCARDPEHPPVVEGAVPITGWREQQVHGVDVLAADAPAARGRALYVGGRRAPRPRYPREGFLWIESQDGLDPSAGFVETLFDGSDRFRFREGDLPELAQPEQVEVVVPHYWVQERMPVVEVDRERREVISSLRSIFALRDDAAHRFARYHLDNVAEAFGEVAGEWYLDPTGRMVGRDGPQLLYRPREGETAETLDVRMPVLDVFVRVRGTGTDPVREVRFESVHFAYADFAEVPPAVPPFGVREDPVLPRDVGFAADVQAASTVPAAIQLDGAHACAFVDGAVRDVGGYAISLGPGSRGNLVSGSTFTDLGAGAVRCGGSADASSPDFTRANEISDNTVERGGRVYPSAVGVLLQHGAHNVVAHNRISDLYYTAISVGWTWDYADSPSQGNLVVGNHLHTLGQGLLNDMGGVYLLGIAPGTVVRGNHIHDVRCANYGGWGIYTDEGSSHVVIESNVVHDVSSQAFHHHYGREVVVRHNVLALGGQGQVSITRPEPSNSFTLERNILLGSGTPGYAGTAGERDVRRYTVTSDLNLFFDLDPVEGAVLAGNGGRRGPEEDWQVVEPLDEEWRRTGHDRYSVVADPCFLDVAARDLRVAEGSPAHALGIVVPDVSGAGPRPPHLRGHPLQPRTRVDQFARPQG
ncbi:right-handed parallel beta-helix repeat-containing protein [Desertihabitans aurantiacus]|uniref:right-handed parallel beta-helix repeat-containing protein n=1 Tax=Desertihabitans aurantiacus TaxID=2282477 RepID=UPI000DF82203|nr:right-handed parallel beta-helix repeat-containing protein [Desertihabitans aurantiacus]